MAKLLGPAGAHNHGVRPTKQILRFRGLIFAFARFVAVGVLFLLFFLLAEALTHHRFSEGGWVHNGRVHP